MPYLQIKTAPAIEPVSLAEVLYQLRLDITTPVLSTGALVVGNWYRIAATQAAHFYAGCAIGDTFQATVATALDASNKVQEIYEGPLLSSYVKAARQHVEDLCGPLISQTWYQYESGWPSGDTLKIGKPHLQTVSSVKYTDSNGVQSTLSAGSYLLDISEWEPGIVQASGENWPTDELLNVNPVVVEFVCGYGAARVNVPEAVRISILMRVSHMYYNRSMEVIMPRMLDDMLCNYRIW